MGCKSFEERKTTYYYFGGERKRIKRKNKMCQNCIGVIERISEKYKVSHREARDLLMNYSAWPFNKPEEAEKQVYEELEITQLPL